MSEPDELEEGWRTAMVQEEGHSCRSDESKSWQPLELEGQQAVYKEDERGQCWLRLKRQARSC